MSALATFWAQKQRPSGGPSAKLVLIALADIHNDHDGSCRPRVATLAERCMMSERQARRILAGLERDGLIARRPRYAKRVGFQVANNYELAITTAVEGKNPCAASPDMDVRPCDPSPDIGVRAKARTSTSALEPSYLEPDPKKRRSPIEGKRGIRSGFPVHQAEEVTDEERRRRVRMLRRAAA